MLHLCAFIWNLCKKDFHNKKISKSFAFIDLKAISGRFFIWKRQYRTHFTSIDHGTKKTLNYKVYFRRLLQADILISNHYNVLRQKDSLIFTYEYILWIKKTNSHCYLSFQIPLLKMILIIHKQRERSNFWNWLTLF